MSKKVNKYKKAGVNINEGNKFVKLIKKKIFSTHNKGAIKDLGSFAGFFDISILKYKNPILLSATDGVGTKIKIAQDLNKYKWIGEDLVAMCLNDILVHGGKPIFFLDYIAVAKLKKKMALEIIDGIVKGCKGSRCSILGGETAEMPGLYKNDDFDLAGFAVG
ncbi:MAG: Phosphoribosylformylglycinamidine cyclo-ligase, partial [Alphaproteobacteria bacterium MarineAlpha6_Bin4]